MKKLAILLVIALCLILCGCPAAAPGETEPELLQVHITAGKIETGMTVKDVFVEVTVDDQPVACRLELTALTDEGYYIMAEDEKVPENFLVRLDIYYSLPTGKTVDDIQETVESDGGQYDGTGSVGNDDRGNVEAWSHIIYGLPEQPQPEQQTDPQPENHTHTWEEKNAGSISCTTDSVITYTCTCGQTKQETVPAPGHDMKDGALTPPTCEDAGSQTKRCTRCSYAIVVETPATGHQWSAWEKDTGRVHKHTCSVCGQTETANHNIPAGEVVCTDCGAAIIN